MDKTKIFKTHNLILKLVSRSEIKDALNSLSEFIGYVGISDYKLRFERLTETYQNILKYTFLGVDDPQRNKIFQDLRLKIIELSDQLKEAIIVQKAIRPSIRKKEVLDKSTELISKSEILFEGFSFENELKNVLEEADLTGESEGCSVERESYLKELFEFFWLSDIYKKKETELLNRIINSEEVTWHEKSIIVSAVTFSVLRYFDINKIDVLFSFYEKRENEVWQRALVGLVISLYVHNLRMDYYPNVNQRLLHLKEASNIEIEIEKIIIQLFKAKDTEKVTKKFQDEIIPEVLKIQPKIKEKLDLDNLLSDDMFDDKNPEWERFFDDAPGLMDKLQELSEMQLDGSDVFMSTFQMLKHFSFFNEIHNWFLPFYNGNKIASAALKTEKTKFDKDDFVDGLAKSTHMCNSDKYSFCLNLEKLPEAQKSMMLEMFNAEIDGMSEVIKDDEILNKQKLESTVFTQYIQDIYRFNKLYNFKEDFIDIFKSKLSFHKVKFFTLFDNIDSIRKIGEYFFSNKYYEEAIEVFEILIKKAENDREIFEKTAYSYEKLGDFSEALKYYKKAELFDENRLWNLKKMALCYRNLKLSDKALECYHEAEKLKDDDLYVQANLGHCYLEKKKYEKALDYYFKVEYLSPSNIKILRPIAWCSFIVGKFDVADKYYKKLLEIEPNKYDFMNFGHLNWSKGDKTEAFEYYKKSILEKNNDFDSFVSGFRDDEQYLLKHGIDENEIPLMLDYLKYQS
ncbi:tetratricopeptide repeat protein [Bacteroidota bacterium]